MQSYVANLDFQEIFYKNEKLFIKKNILFIIKKNLVKKISPVLKQKLKNIYIIYKN